MSESSKATKTRLLDAAEELFGSKGFEEVSIRELATAAQVNVAAVNYHFHSKENLFHQVILRRFVTQRDITLAALEETLAKANGEPSVEDVIAALTWQHLAGAIAMDQRVNFLSLMVDQMSASHSHAHEAFFKEMVQPVVGAFSRALLAAKPQLTREDLTWITGSIIGQTHHFIMRWKKKEILGADSKSVQAMRAVFPALDLAEEQYIEEVTNHITRFSSAAIKALVAEAEK